MLPLYHEFINSKHYLKLHSPFSRAIIKLEENPRKIISKWWARQPKEYFERLIDIFKGVALHVIQFVVQRYTSNPCNSGGSGSSSSTTSGGDAPKTYIGYEPNLEIALIIMKMLFRINHKQRAHKVPYELFHLPELNEVCNLQQDYIFWLMDKNVSVKDSFKRQIKYLIKMSCRQHSPVNFIYATINSYLMPKRKRYCCKRTRQYKCKVQ